jgi:hypothetical protein
MGVAGLVRWNEEERAMLAREVYETINKLPTMPIAEALEQAIRKLPRHRRRTLPYPRTQAPWLIEQVNALRHSARAKAAAPTPPPPSRFGDKRESETALLDAVKQLTREIIRLRHTVVTLTRTNAPIHADDVAARQNIASAAARAAEFSSPLHHVPRVFLHGPEPEQQQLLKREFGELLDLRFQSDGKDLQKEQIGSADAVISWLRFASHADVNVARRHAKDHHKKHYTITGGMTSLRSVLEEIALTAMEG